MAVLTAQYLSEKAALQCNSPRLLKSTLWATHSLLKQIRVLMRTSSPSSSAVPRSNLQHAANMSIPLKTSESP